MILQCPACNAQYRIQSNAVSTAGRKVKCAKCAHIWVAQAQDVIEELAQPVQIETPMQAAVGDYRFAAESKGPEMPSTPPSFTVVPQATREPDFQVPEQPSIEVPSQQPPQEPSIEMQAREYPRIKPTLDPDREAAPRFAGKHIEKEKSSGFPAFIVSVLLIGVIVTGIILGRVQIVKKWEATALFYDMIGLHVPVTGEGLRFENIKTAYDKNAEGEPVISLQGEILNVSKESKSIPSVQIQPFNKKNEVLSKALIKIETDVLKPGERAKFSAQVPASTTLDPQDKFVFVDE